MEQNYVTVTLCIPLARASRLSRFETVPNLCEPRSMRYEWPLLRFSVFLCCPVKKGKGSPYSITDCRVPELIPVLGSQSAGGVSHKPGGRLLLLSAKPAVAPATLKRAATNFAAW